MLLRRRRRLLAGAVIVWGLLLTAGCGAGDNGPGSGADGAGMTSAYVKLAWAATEVMAQEGYLEELGYEVTWRELASPAEVVSGFATGELDVAPQSVGIAANMYAEGVPFEIVGTGLTVYGQIVVPADSEVTSPADLAGKKIASSTGTSTHAFVVLLAKEIYGIDLAAETDIVHAATPPDIANLLTTGEADAGIIWTPLAEVLTSAGDYRVIATQQEMWRQAFPDEGDMIHIVYIAQPGYVQDHPSLPDDLQEATGRIVDLWQQDPARVQEILVDINELPTPVVEHAFETSARPLSGLTDDDVAQVKRQWRLLAEADYFEQPPDLSDDAVQHIFP